MVKDKRAKTVKLLIEHNEIKIFSQIFEHIPITIVATKALGTNYERLTDRINNPGKFRMSDIVLLAAYFEVQERIMIDLIYQQLLMNRSKKKK
jgi:K+-transporting ATPase A subunit